MNESMERNCYKPCKHVTRYKRNALDTYEILHAYFVACIARNDALDLKEMIVRCFKPACEERKIHACLSCKYFGCFKGHIQNHSRKKNHSLSMDTTFGALFCYKCNDFQYDKDFEKISRKQFCSPVCPRGLIYNNWIPSIEQINILRDHNIIDITDLGLKGFLNLGNICFASCIFQALIHAPVFRNYFLSLKHRCGSRPGRKEFKDKILEDVPSCFLCEVCKIVLECFSGKLESVKPTDFMLLFWVLSVKSEDFAANVTSDAFLFYTNLVEYLHSALQDKPSGQKHENKSIEQKQENKSSEQNHENRSSEQLCHCDIEVMFSGSHKNVFTCKECGNVSSMTDQFKSIHFNSKPKQKSGSTVVTFKDCLEENLRSVVQEYDCEKCQMKKPNDCETIFERLPLICCFQLNISAAAFTAVEKKKEKIPVSGVIVRFEEYFDMSPYKYSLEQRRKECDKIHPDPSNFYYLFAVVEYKIVEKDQGHYVSYVRRNRSNWFECDDETVQPIGLEAVKKINPYLLFYQRPVDEASRLLLSNTEKGTKRLISLVT